MLEALQTPPWISTDRPDGERPTRAQLRASRTAAFFVDATLTKLSEEDDPFVSCAVSVILATYPNKSMFGFLNEKSEALLLPQENEAAPSKADILSARQRCVAELIEFVILKKVIPALQKRATE